MMLASRSVLIWFLIGCATGCGSLPQADFGTSAEASPSTAVVRGDWNDLDAALLVAASEAEMAVVSSEGDDSAFSAELTTPRDDRVTVWVTRQAADRFEVRVRAGLFGDPESERRLVGAFSRRLEQLHGREWAPVR